MSHNPYLYRHPLIMDEIERRLKVLPIKEAPHRGIPGQDVDTYPSVWAFDDTETYTKDKYGIYLVKLTLILEYFNNGVSQKNASKLSDKMKCDLIRAIEIDERMTVDVEGVSTDLLLDYSRVSVDKIYYKSPLEVLNVSVVYDLRYAEAYPGNENRRTS